MKLKLLHVNRAHELLLITETLLSTPPRVASHFSVERRGQHPDGAMKGEAGGVLVERQTSHLQRGRVSPAPGHRTQDQHLGASAPSQLCSLRSQMVCCFKIQAKGPSK